MHHPFDIEPAELELFDMNFKQLLKDEDAEQVGGGLSIATTLGIGEEGGFKPVPLPFPRPIPVPSTKPQPPIVCITYLCVPHPLPPFPCLPIKTPIATTFAVGDEGGDPVYTKALWENG